MFGFALPGDKRRPFWENVLEYHTSKCDLKLNIIIVEGTERKHTYGSVVYILYSVYFST